MAKAIGRSDSSWRRVRDLDQLVSFVASMRCEYNSKGVQVQNKLLEVLKHFSQRLETQGEANLKLPSS